MVAPSQILFTLELCVVGKAGGITLTISDEEGASLDSDESGLFSSGGSFKDRTTAGICVFILLRYRENMDMMGFWLSNLGNTLQQRWKKDLRILSVISRHPSSLTCFDEQWMGVLL